MRSRRCTPGQAASQLILGEVGRYYDHTLDDRVNQAFDEAFQRLSDEVDDLNNIVAPRYDDEIAELRDSLETINEALKPIRQQLEPIREQTRAWRQRVEQVYQQIAADLEAEVPDLDDIKWPEPADGDEHPDPLFDSRRSYVDQIAVYKEHQGRPTEKRAWGSNRQKANGEAAP